MAALKGQGLRNRLRLGSGLVLFTFVTGHLLNHALGLISLEAMQSATAIFIDPWRTWPGLAVLASAITIHTCLALWSFWNRRNFRLKAWEAVQLGLGLAIPPLLGAHVAANLILPSISAYRGTYLEVLALFAIYAPVRGFFMALALIVVWTHGCVGLHSWFRLHAGYARIQPLAFALALLVPAMALAGFLAATTRVHDLAARPGELQIDYSLVQPWMPDFVFGTETKIFLFMLALLAARAVKGFVSSRRQKFRLTYSPGDRAVALLADATLLESIRGAGLAHASICGGRGRCTTCRVHVGEGLEDLPPPNAVEQKALARVTDSPSVRLACQIRPKSNISVVALVPDDAGPAAALTKPGYRQGQELNVSVLFVDLRDSTKLCEDRLPFDVVFVLNQVFSELTKALDATNGHYSQFNGDGLMAIYGLDSSAEHGATEAISGALAMLKRLEKLNDRLRHELTENLKIGIGIHTGEAIVGSMGPPASPIVSALGDNINVAARLETQTKEFGVPLVVSADTAELSSFDFSGFEKHRIQVKGRTGKIVVYAVDKPGDLVEVTGAAQP